MKSNTLTRIILIISIISLLIFLYKTLKPTPNTIVNNSNNTTESSSQIKTNRVNEQNSNSKEDNNQTEDFSDIEEIIVSAAPGSKNNKPKETKKEIELRERITDSIITIINDEFEFFNDEFDRKINDQTQLIKQIATELEENKILLQKTRKEEFDIQGKILNLPDSLSYFYNAILYNNLAKTEAYKLNQQISFHIDFLYKLDIINYNVDNLKKSENQVVNTIKTRNPMKYAVIHFESNIGQIYKNKKEITTDTIRLNMLNFDYKTHSRSLNYTLKINDKDIENKTEAHIDAHIDYYDYENNKYFISQNQKLTLYVFPNTNLDYLSMKFDENMKFGIDKLFYLITSIIGLIITATLNYVKKKLKLPTENQNISMEK